MKVILVLIFKLKVLELGHGCLNFVTLGDNIPSGCLNSIVGFFVVGCLFFNILTVERILITALITAYTFLL